MTENNIGINKRIIGLDFGSKRIGVAVSDELGSLAFPLTVVSGFGHDIDKREARMEQAEQEILNILNEKNVKVVIMGHSVNLKGEDNAIMEDAKWFGDRLKTKGFEVYYEPELYSTVSATKFQGENIQVDASAAAIILQSYLDRIKFKNMDTQNQTQAQTPAQVETEVKQAEIISGNAKEVEVVKDETNYISIDDFIKVEMRIGQILSAEKIEGSDKLLKLSVDLGEESPRQVLSGIAKLVGMEEIIGKKFPFVTNLAPRKMMGMESQAMILAGSAGDELALLNPSKDLPNGTKLK